MTNIIPFPKPKRPNDQECWNVYAAELLHGTPEKAEALSKWNEKIRRDG